jgi:hypothetical protein
MYSSPPFPEGKMAEGLRTRIERAILTGRHRWGLHELEQVYAEYEKASPEERKRITERQNSQFYFLTKYTAIAGFYEFVEQKCASAVMYRNLRRVITKTIVASIVHEAGADLREFDKVSEPKAGGAEGVSSPDGGGEGQYTRRQVQDILRTGIPGEFIRGDETPSSAGDRRLRPVRSVHAPVPLPPSPQRSIASQAIQLETSAMNSNEYWLRLKETGSALRFLSPAFLGSLKLFREIIRSTLSSLSGLTPEESERRGVLSELLLGGITPSLIALHHDVSSQVALRWWRKRGAAMRKELIAKPFHFAVNTVRIQDSVKLLHDLGWRPIDVFLQLSLSALVLDGIEQTSDAVLVWRFLSDMPGLPLLERTIAADNTAVLLTRQGHWKLAQPLFSRAIAGYGKAGDNYGKAVALKSRGEARIRAGSESGTDDLREAERLGDSLDPEQRFRIHGNLAMAAQRLRDSENLRRHLKRCLDDRDDVDPEWVIRVCELLDRLSGFS